MTGSGERVVTETAARLRWEPAGTYSRRLREQAGGVGEHGAGVRGAWLGHGRSHWMRIRASYEMAQARRPRGWRKDLGARDAAQRLRNRFCDALRWAHRLRRVWQTRCQSIRPNSGECKLSWIRTKIGRQAG